MAASRAPVRTCRTFPAALIGLVFFCPVVGQLTVTKEVESVRESRRIALRDRPLAALPIGVFDSGTGGLAVLGEVLRLDQFNNETRAPGADGRPDFESEQFVFLADQANMPYGNYPAAGRTGYLVDLALNDAIFLLTRDYSPDPRAVAPKQDRLPAKALLIACNTATAYGKNSIESFIAETGLGIAVIDVITAGATGALERVARGSGGTVGVMATRGTCDSNAYPNQIRILAGQLGLAGVPVVQQGSIGLAGAIDGVREFLVDAPAGTVPRTDYRGPAINHPTAPIDVSVLPRYAFDFTNGQMLWKGSTSSPAALQINSIENYVAYEVVSLLETLRKRPGAKPLTTVVLGCTHFPYYAQLFREQFRRCYAYQENGQHIYRPILAAEVELIDPASTSGRLLYETLAGQARLRESASGQPSGEFYVTVPNPDYPGVKLDSSGGFTYDYKYSRTQAPGASDFRIVPLTTARLPAAMADRLRRQLPCVWRLLESFSERR